MSRDQLIDLITHEVLKIVKERGGGKGATASAVRPDPDLMVANAITDSSLGTDPLFVVCGNPTGKEKVIETFNRIRKHHKRLSVILSPAARELFTDSKRIFAGLTKSAQDPGFQASLERVTSVTLLNVSVNTLAKMAQLIADTEPTIAVFFALKRGLPVRMVTDPLTDWHINPGITRKIESQVHEVASFGIQPITASGFDQMLRSDGPPPTTNFLVVGPGAVRSANPGLPGNDTDCRSCGWAGHCASLCNDRVSAVIDSGAARLATLPGVPRPKGGVPGMIDHTLLKPDATEDEIRKLCEEAATHQFMSVCVNPSWVHLSARLLKGTGVKVCTVVGFPLGATTSASKEAETRDAVRSGAEEIDMVINVGALKAGHYSLVLEDIKAVVRGAQGKLTKVILETALLTDDEKVKACELAKDAGADFVKTSTGFGPGGATVEDISLMRRTVGPRMGVKASGGVRDLTSAQAMIDAGATRIGASASVAIAQQSRGISVSGPVKDDYGYGSKKSTLPSSSGPTCG